MWDNPNGVSPPPLFPKKEGRSDPALYAPNGGQLITRNLNADSTHPNPWRPPTWFECAVPDFRPDLNLTTWMQPALIKQDLWFEQKELSEKLTWYGIRAGLLGNVFATWDLLTRPSSQALTIPGKVARWGYLVSPYVAMSTSFIATHHLLNKNSKKPNEPWIYGASWLPSSAIWGAYKRSVGSFVRSTALGVPLLMLIKKCFDMGVGFNSLAFKAYNEETYGHGMSSTANDPRHGFAKTRYDWANNWQSMENPQWPVRNFDKDFWEKEWELEPSWKKHLPAEDRNKGPATGL